MLHKSLPRKSPFINYFPRISRDDLSYAKSSLAGKKPVSLLDRITRFEKTSTPEERSMAAPQDGHDSNYEFSYQ
jgi:hypothetical protein